MSLFSKAPGSRRRAATSSFASWASLTPPASIAAKSFIMEDRTQDAMSAPLGSLDGYFRRVEEARAGETGWVRSLTELHLSLDLQT